MQSSYSSGLSWFSCPSLSLTNTHTHPTASLSLSWLLVPYTCTYNAMESPAGTKFTDHSTFSLPSPISLPHSHQYLSATKLTSIAIPPEHYLVHWWQRHPSEPSHRICMSHSIPVQGHYMTLPPGQSGRSPHETWHSHWPVDCEHPQSPWRPVQWDIYTCTQMNNRFNSILRHLQSN